MSNRSNLFGEPVAIIGALQAFLIMLVSFGGLSFIGLNSQTDVAVVAVAANAGAALYLALSTNRTLLAPVMELFKALIAVGVIYGFHINTEQTGDIAAFLTVLVAFYHRSKVVPLAEATFLTS